MCIRDRLWAAVSASALQSFTFVSQCWAAVSASALQSSILHLSPSSDCCVRLCLAILYLSPSSGLHVATVVSLFIVYPDLPQLWLRVEGCLPVSTFVSQLWTAVAASALQSFVSQLWTSQTLVAECSAIENYKLFGVYGGVIFCFSEAPVSHVLPVLRMVFGVLLKAQNEIAEPFARFSHQNSSSPSSQSPLISRNSPLLRVTCAAERR